MHEKPPFWYIPNWIGSERSSKSECNSFFLLLSQAPLSPWFPPWFLHQIDLNAKPRFCWWWETGDISMLSCWILWCSRLFLLLFRSWRPKYCPLWGEIILVGDSVHNSGRSQLPCPFPVCTTSWCPPSAPENWESRLTRRLSVFQDDIITVISRVDENWAEGKIGDKVGIFPILFVEVREHQAHVWLALPQS